MNGPVASNLVLLNELDTVAQGSKVRFLGCVDDYLLKTATLRLKHHYPPSKESLVVNVHVDQLLETIKPMEVDVGTWLNVIGHVEYGKEKGVSVQAVAVWDAGNMDLGAYEAAVAMRKHVG